jgi:hypothetical protein
MTFPGQRQCPLPAFPKKTFYNFEYPISVHIPDISF